MITKRIFTCGWALVLNAMVAWSAGLDSARLARQFAAPPAAARPWVYWMWMDGNLSRAGMTADLEAMKRAGIGGVIIMEVNAGIPPGPVKFMSPEWRQLFKHVVGEAERLGLQITLNAGPGWTGSGGPWVKPEQSMQHIVASAVEVAGPQRYDGLLPSPQRRKAFFGEGAMPPELEKAKNDFYRDVAVLAFPTPSEKYAIADLDEKALYVRAPYSSQPGVKPYLPSPTEYPALSTGAVISSTRILDFSDRLMPDGQLAWDVPAGNWTLLRFGRASTGANTRPAPGPGLGLECDKLDAAALDAHFEHFAVALLGELGPRKSSVAGWTSLHIDSWEMGAQNWTASFREEFQQRRGYDLLRYLPAVTGRVVDSLEISERFLWDLRQTVQELILEKHARHLKELGHRHGLGLSIEPYDMTPCADMSLGAVADVPMCEFWLYGFNTSYSVLEAASIAHTCGRPVVAAEAFTSSDAERWQAYPGSMKGLGDWAFCAGVNRIVFHRYQHQPWLDRRPGMTMGPYGVHWERTQTWWDMAPAFHTYLARCQWLLRQGLPVADVCYLVAEGAPQVFRPPASAIRGNPPDRLGYNFDGCAPETLLERMSVKAGKLTLPDGMSYRVLVLPERKTITPKLLRKVRELVAAGATVIGPRPQKSPGLSGYPQCDAEINQLAGEMWGDCDGIKVTEHAFGKGRIVWRDGRMTEAKSAEDNQNVIQRAKWIWHKEGNPASRAPVAERYFRRLLTLTEGQPVESARVWMTADNTFELWVNGQKAGEGDNFNEISHPEVTALVKPGVNILTVAARNGGDAPNPAGLIGILVVKYRNGQTVEIPTDNTWQSATTTTDKWITATNALAGWGAAMELGRFGMAPWSRIGGPPPTPEQFGDFAAIAGVLSKMGLPLDFESASNVRYTHRRDGTMDIYFVSNPDDHPVSANCTFRVHGLQPELWDAVSGKIQALPEFAVNNERTILPLHFEPLQSFFVVFRKPATASKKGGLNFLEARQVAELKGPWEASFDPKWGGPGKVNFSELEDWSRRPEPGIKYYSGTATYRKVFDLPQTPARQSIYLDLGLVKNLARVRLNGHDLGVVWCAPWRVELTSAVKMKGNQLEIAVVNLWPNRLIGDEQLPPDAEYARGGNIAKWPDWLLHHEPRPSPGRYTFSTWKFFNQDSPLLPSGLLGPVTLKIR